jgi:hypothetical protein
MGEGLQSEWRHSDEAERATLLRKTARWQESEAKCLHRLALDCGRWGLMEAEADARHQSRAMAIEALLNHARAAAQSQSVIQVPRLTS